MFELERQEVTIIMIKTFLLGTHVPFEIEHVNEGERNVVSAVTSS
jgi:hypothetical protein